MDRLIIECKNGKEIIADRKRVIITNMGDSINSVYDDYYSIFASNDSVVYFTSRRPAKLKSKRNEICFRSFELRGITLMFASKITTII